MRVASGVDAIRASWKAKRVMMIRLRTLGSIELHSTDGEPLDAVIAQPKRLALLAYLALARPFGFHRRDRLFAMFWPEQDESRARDSLNQAIRFLRQSLGSSVVVSRGAEEVGLDRAQLWCDALEFQAALEQEKPREAIELYRGELLSGFFIADSHGFDEWLEAERGRLREQAAHAARLVAEGEEAAGNLTQALLWGRLAVNLTSGDERALRRWLMMLARAGDRAGAIQAYEDFARRLREEYEADPSPETQDLVETIRREAGKPLADQRSRFVADSPPRQETPGPESSPFSPGGVLAHGWYVITREIGAGGMATVYLARDVRHDRWVVVKVLRAEIAVAVGVEGFLREIRIAAALQHPHIVPVFDSGTVDGRLYFVMPLVEGESLRARLKREGALPLGDALRITREVADALAYAHKQAIVHRDIKPENILLTGEPGTADLHAIVADFGIARAIETSGAEKQLTQTGLVVGSPAYMSPEQASGEPFDGRSDVYSLGCVLYEMLVARPPFTALSAAALAARHVLVDAPSVRAVRPSVPAQVDHSIARALAKSPSDRFQTASDFSSALDASEATTSSPPSYVGGSDKKPATPHRPHLRRLLRIVIAGSLISVVAAGGWVEWRQSVQSEFDRSREAYPLENIAVLYLQDRSPGGQLRYLADGLTDEVMKAIGALPQFSVASRYAVAPERTNGRTALDTVLRELKIGTVLRGTVSPRGLGTRVSIEMVDALSGHVIGTARVDDEERNGIRLQDSLLQATTRLLRKRVGNGVPELTNAFGTRNPAAWDAMQRSKEIEWEVDRLIAARDISAALPKISAADSALAGAESLDVFWPEPTIERSHLALVRVLESVGAGLYKDSNDRKQLRDGIAHAERALKAVPNDPNALVARGSLHFLQWVLDSRSDSAAAAALLRSADEDLTRTTTVNKPLASAWNALSRLRIGTGDTRGAAIAAENALKADPYSPEVNGGGLILRLVWSLQNMEYLDDARKWCAIGYARFPQDFRFAECRLRLATLPGANRSTVSELWKLYDDYTKIAPANQEGYHRRRGKLIIAYALARAGQLDSARALIRANDGDSTIDPDGDLSSLAAMALSQLGDNDAAIDVLAKLFLRRPALRKLARDDKTWYLKSLRSDPRYQALLHRSH